MNQRFFTCENPSTGLFRLWGPNVYSYVTNLARDCAPIRSNDPFVEYQPPHLDFAIEKNENPMATQVVVIVSSRDLEKFPFILKDLGFSERKYAA